MGKKFYAVKIGRVPGIYNSWSECEKNVKKFPKAVFKKFSDQRSAEEFISGLTTRKRKRDMHEIYTDGSIGSWGFVHVFGNKVIYEDNGKVILDKDHDSYLGASKMTNNTGELTAIGEALRYIIAKVPDEVCIRYDSVYAANSIQGIFNGLKNKLLIYKIRDLYKEVNERVSFDHIKAHSGNKFNDRADELASKKRQKLN